jgi:hypothetical protein
MSVVDDSFGNPLKLEQKASMLFAGGIGTQGYQCGMLWGAALAAGAQAYRLFGSGPLAETAALLASQKTLEAFRSRTKNEINCLEITDMNFQGDNPVRQVLKFLFKGGPINCFSMAAKYAPLAFNAINSSLSREDIRAVNPPISCSAVLAQRMGASELHTVMAAGLAGGIGLSGGACGVLGAAIWISAMNRPGDEIGLNIMESWAGEVIEDFLKSSDYTFECSEIVGGKFETIDEHASYLRAGGCAEIIKTLAEN